MGMQRSPAVQPRLHHCLSAHIVHFSLHRLLLQELSAHIMMMMITMMATTMMMMATFEAVSGEEMEYRLPMVAVAYTPLAG